MTIKMADVLLTPVYTGPQAHAPERLLRTHSQLPRGTFMTYLHTVVSFVIYLYPRQSCQGSITPRHPKSTRVGMGEAVEEDWEVFLVVQNPVGKKNRARACFGPLALLMPIGASLLL